MMKLKLLCPFPLRTGIFIMVPHMQECLGTFEHINRIIDLESY